MTDIMEDKVARAICQDLQEKGLIDMESSPDAFLIPAKLTARAAIKAHATALKDAGMVIVPREPTDKMAAVGNAAWLEDRPAGYIFRSMISAAPEEPDK